MKHNCFLKYKDYSNISNCYFIYRNDISPSNHSIHFKGSSLLFSSKVVFYDANFMDMVASIPLSNTTLMYSKSLAIFSLEEKVVCVFWLLLQIIKVILWVLFFEQTLFLYFRVFSHYSISLLLLILTQIRLDMN